MSQIKPQWGTSASVDSPAFQTRRKPRRWVIFAVAALLYLPATLYQWTARDGWWIALGVLLTVAGVAAGAAAGAKGRPPAGGRAISAVVLLAAATVPFGAYLLAWVVARSVPLIRSVRASSSPGSSPSPAAASAGKSVASRAAIAAVAASRDPLNVARHQAEPSAGRPGGHAGWDHRGQALSASPRGGLLVIGPPGSGKSSSCLIPTVLLAPGACVASSTKDDLLSATWEVRHSLGEVWVFDPRPDVAVPSGALRVHWSPLVGIRRWEDAQTVAARLATPLRGSDKESHFIDRATAWLEVLLWAAACGDFEMRDVLRWVNQPTDEEGTVGEVVAAITGGSDEITCEIALSQYGSLTGADERERSSVVSTMTRMVRVYSSPSILAAAKDVNFDPEKFVRSEDTLYITSPGEQQTQFGPLIVALIEAIRQAAYALHEELEGEQSRARETGSDYQRPPHITFVLDEANSTAPIPLPAIIADAGGQGVHIVVGIQDLDRAKERWGKGAEGFLSMFPNKLIFPGLLDHITRTLSDASGEFDRVSTSHSQSLVNDGRRLVAVDSPSTTTSRQKVLTPGDVSTIPQGQALRWEGARWELVNVGFHWQDPYWTMLTERCRSTLYDTYSRMLVEHPEMVETVRATGFAVSDGTVRGFRDASNAPTYSTTPEARQ